MKEKTLSDFMIDFTKALTGIQTCYFNKDNTYFNTLGDIICPKIILNDINETLLKTMLPQLSDHTIYNIRTKTMLNFVAFSFDNSYFLIGPFLPGPPSEWFYNQLLEQFDQSMLIPVKLFYSTLPISNSPYIIAVAHKVAKYLVDPEVVFNNEQMEDNSKLHITKHINQTGIEEEVTMDLLEQRYETENHLLLAVKNGQKSLALQYWDLFVPQKKVLIREKDPIRNSKNLVFVLNTLLRKAAQDGYVHPVYLDLLSSNYSHQIELASSVKQLLSLENEMIFSYCDLVKKHSLQGYSPLIRKAINYINMNLSNELTLTIIANKTGVSPTYLSSIFNKEVDQNISSYINQKRIGEACRILNDTHLQIQEVAFRVGFSDVNYFTKVFKKQIGITPNAFRKQMQ